MASSGDCDALLRFALATFALKRSVGARYASPLSTADLLCCSHRPSVADAYDVVLGTLGECLDFLQAADGSDREEEAAQVSQLLGDVLRDKKQRAQVLKMLVDALTQCAEDEDVQFTESVSQGAITIALDGGVDGHTNTGWLKCLWSSDYVRVLCEPHARRE